MKRAAGARRRAARSARADLVALVVHLAERLGLGEHSQVAPALREGERRLGGRPAHVRRPASHARPPRLRAGPVLADPAAAGAAGLHALREPVGCRRPRRTGRSRTPRRARVSSISASPSGVSIRFSFCWVNASSSRSASRRCDGVVPGSAPSAASTSSSCWPSATFEGLAVGPVVDVHVARDRHAVDRAVQQAERRCHGGRRSVTAASAANAEAATTVVLLVERSSFGTNASAARGRRAARPCRPGAARQQRSPVVRPSALRRASCVAACSCSVRCVAPVAHRTPAQLTRAARPGCRCSARCRAGRGRVGSTSPATT